MIHAHKGRTRISARRPIRPRRKTRKARIGRRRLPGRLSQAILRDARSVGRWWWLCGWNCHRDIFVIIPGRLSREFARAWSVASAASTVPIFVAFSCRNVSSLMGVRQSRRRRLLWRLRRLRRLRRLLRRLLRRRRQAVMLQVLLMKVAHGLPLPVEALPRYISKRERLFQDAFVELRPHISPGRRIALWSVRKHWLHLLRRQEENVPAN